MFSDYTVKKMVPRLVIAVIAVNLSWAICQAAISMTNTLGDGIGDLIRAAAIPNATGASYATFQNIDWTGLVAGTAVTGVAAGAGVVALFTGGVFAALGAIITALAALFMGFAVLMVRRFFIATLVLVSPLALVCWAIPGMEKWAKRWWDLFIKLLLMFPFIMAMFAVSDVLAVVLKDSAGNFIGQLMLVIIRFAPFALIPLVFKIAGGAFSTLTGMVNDKGKGVFDRGKSWSKERAGQTHRALRKQGRKDAKLSLKKENANLRAISDLEGGLNEEKLRGPFSKTRSRMNRASLYGYSNAGGMSQAEQARLGGKLSEMVTKQKLEFATAEVNNAVIKEATVKGQLGALERIYEEADRDGDAARKDAAYSKIVDLKGVEQMERIQQKAYDSASAKEASGDTEGSEQVLRDFNQRQGKHFGATKEFAGHLAGDIDTSKSLDNTRLGNLQGLTIEQLATQKDQTWSTYASLSPQSATLAYKSVETAGGSSAAKLSTNAHVSIVEAAGPTIPLTRTNTEIDADLAGLPAGPQKVQAVDRARKDRDKASLDSFHATL